MLVDLSSGGLLDGSAGQDIEDHGGVIKGTYGLLDIDMIIPKTGRYLSLDVSKTSTGFTIVEDHKMAWANIELKTSMEAVHGEALLRREFRRELKRYIGGMAFDAIVVEDVFSGSQVQGVRSLYALNTVIDDMILDGDISCPDDSFVRVQNGMWKKWLRTLDPEGMIRAHNDKQQIAKLLELVGIVAEGKGYQDRLDSMGMLAGYFLVKRGFAGTGAGKEVKKTSSIKIGDVKAEYVANKSEMEAIVKMLEGPVEKFHGKLNQKTVLQALHDRPKHAYYTPNLVSIGQLATKLGVKAYPFGGYLVFYLK